MMDPKSQLERAYHYCALLGVDPIREEIESHLTGYTLKNVSFKNREWICSYENESGNSICLIISFYYVHLLKSFGNKVERITIDDNLVLEDREIEKKDDSILYSINEKKYGPSKKHDYKVALTDITTKRCAISREEIQTILEGMDYDSCRLMPLLLRLRIRENQLAFDVQHINIEEERNKETSEGGKKGILSRLFHRRNKNNML